MVPVGDGRGLMRWAMVSGMLMVRGEMCGCTGFTGDSGASCFSLFSLDKAVNVILMFVLGNLNVHLQKKTSCSATVCPPGNTHHCPEQRSPTRLPGINEQVRGRLIMAFKMPVRPAQWENTQVTFNLNGSF